MVMKKQGETKQSGIDSVRTASLIPWSFLNSSAANLYSGLRDLQWPHLLGLG